MNQNKSGDLGSQKIHQFFHLLEGHFWDNTSISSDPWSLGPTYLTLFAEASGKSYLGKEQEKNGDVSEIFLRFSIDSWKELKEKKDLKDGVNLIQVGWDHFRNKGLRVYP